MRRAVCQSSAARAFDLRGPPGLATFGEISVAHWRFPQPNAAGRRRITVVGLTPHLRLRDTRIERWFFDVGIGLNTLTDLYETRDRRFSTRLQFSDHLAFGHAFGAVAALGLSCRFIHDSNAGIRHPNPGVNFHALRLECRVPYATVPPPPVRATIPACHPRATQPWTIRSVSAAPPRTSACRCRRRFASA